MGRVVNGVLELIDGVRGDVGDFRESAVLRLVKANSSSFSEGVWRRGERRREGTEDMLDASLMSVAVRVETSVTTSESVPDEDASLADEAEDKGRIDIFSGMAMLGNIGGRTGAEGGEQEGTIRGAGFASSRLRKK